MKDIADPKQEFSVDTVTSENLVDISAVTIEFAGKPYYRSFLTAKLLLYNLSYTNLRHR